MPVVSVPPASTRPSEAVCWGVGKAPADGFGSATSETYSKSRSRASPRSTAGGLSNPVSPTENWL